MHTHHPSTRYIAHRPPPLHHLHAERLCFPYTLACLSIFPSVRSNASLTHVPCLACDAFHSQFVVVVKIGVNASSRRFLLHVALHPPGPRLRRVDVDPERLTGTATAASRRIRRPSQSRIQWPRVTPVRSQIRLFDLCVAALRLGCVTPVLSTDCCARVSSLGVVCVMLRSFAVLVNEAALSCACVWCD